MDRSEAINILKTLKANCSKYFPEHQALELAIASLKTVDYFETMAEDVEKYTKSDVVGMLTELKQEIEETVKEEELIDKKWAKGLYHSEKIIQQKIDKLKEHDNETN